MTETEKDTSPQLKTAKDSTKKTTLKAETADVFSLSSIEFPEIFRSASEKGMKQARESYEKFRAAAEDATDLLEDHMHAIRGGLLELNTKALDAGKANMDAALNFARELLGVTSVAEAIELQTAFARAQFELFAKQGKDVQDLLQRLATDSSAPVKDAFARIMKEAKAA